MFDKLISLLLQAWSALAPFVVINVYEVGAVLRCGRYHRTIAPGLRWKLPGFESVEIVDTVMTTLRLQPQTCTTSDGKSVVVCGIVKYRITDVAAYICNVFDQHAALTDMAMGALLRAVRDHSFEDLVACPPERRVPTVLPLRSQAVAMVGNHHGMQLNKLLPHTANVLILITNCVMRARFVSQTVLRHTQGP